MPSESNIHNQDKIWDYWQNEAPQRFRRGETRHRFLAKQVRPQSKVLNIGVGGGVFEKIALNMELDVYSLDPNEQSIDMLDKHFGLGEKARVGYAQTMPFDDDFFDAVVISETIEHLSEEMTRQTLNEIHRVLVSSGLIIGTVPARENLGEQLAVCPDCGKRFHRWGHLQSFQPDDIRMLLSRKFVVKEVVERPFVSWKTANWKGMIQGLLKLALWRIGVHGDNEKIVFAAEKQ